MVVLDSRENRIVQILGDLIQQRREHRSINIKAVAAQYPDLMPDLAIRLAAVQAKEPPNLHCVKGDQLFSMLGEAFAEMESVECLDQGAQGHVYKAWHRPTRREVAIKILLHGPASTVEQRYRFQQEVELVARLRHPNIVCVYDSGEISGYLFIVMEYVQGLRIDDYVCFEQLPVRRIVSLVCTICDTVHYAHQHAVLHRDLKPSNILVDSGGKPHILDFGLAKDIEPEQDHSNISLTGQVVGTLPYLSPDQVRGEPSSIQTDVYALGVIFYELLTGEYPYPIDDNRYQSLSNIVTREPVSPRKKLAMQPRSSLSPSDVNGDLERIVLKALAKEPNRRYESTAAFADDLRRYLAGDAVLARSASRVYVLRKTVRKFRTLFIALFACIAVLSISLAAVTGAWQRSNQVAKVAMAGLEMASLLKVGSVERDTGRLEDAIKLFEKVIEIGNSTSTDDPVVLRQLFNAHHRLSELHFDHEQFNRAAGHVQKAFELAGRLVQRDGRNEEFQSMLAFGLVSQGRLHFHLGQYGSALDYFQKACAIQEQLHHAQPANGSLAGDLAFSLGRLGTCARKLGRMDEAIQSYERAYEITRSVYEESPESLPRALELVIAESKLAVVYLSFRLPEQDSRANDWLQKARHRFTSLKQHPKAQEHAWRMDKVSFELENNQAILDSRITNGHPLP